MSVSDDLRQAVLQAAIQGKLTKQLLEDGNAKDLLEQIKAEKAKLIKEGKLKKEKPLPEITEDEKPFDIPENWEWVRLNDVSLMIGDIDHKMPSTVEDDGVPYISPLNFKRDGGIDYDNAKQISITDYERLAKKCVPSKNDIIFPRYGTIGVVRLVDTDRKFLVSYSCCTIKSLPDKEMSYHYVFYTLQSELIKEEIKKYINKTTQPNVGLQSIKQFLFPLPPLSEQKRIVAKVEELVAKIDDLEKTEKELEALKKAFPADMKAALLQAAMQGKLTEQLPEDGNAKDLLEQIKAEKEKLIKEGKLKKEKSLPEITEDEKPFDIPENWEWVRLGELFVHASGKQQSSSNKADGTPQKFITTSNLYWGYFVLDTVKTMNFTDAERITCSATKGDLLVCEGGAGYGRSAIWDKEYDICLQNHIHRLRPIVSGVCKYVYYCMYFLKENNRLAPVGTAMPGLSANRLKGLAIPLPPLLEQKRIVEKLEKLLPLCDGLK